jgi:hypothetical protein
MSPLRITFTHADLQRVRVAHASDLSVALARVLEGNAQATIWWDGTPLRLPIWVLSDRIDEIVDTVEAVAMRRACSRHWLCFGVSQGSDFDVDWRLEWSDDRVTIDAGWTGTGDPSIAPEALTPVISLSRREFVAAWEPLLRFFVEASEGVALDHEEERRRIIALFPGSASSS